MVRTLRAGRSGPRGSAAHAAESRNGVPDAGILRSLCFAHARRMPRTVLARSACLVERSRNRFAAVAVVVSFVSCVSEGVCVYSWSTELQYIQFGAGPRRCLPPLLQAGLARLRASWRTSIAVGPRVGPQGSPVTFNCLGEHTTKDILRDLSRGDIDDPLLTNGALHQGLEVIEAEAEFTKSTRGPG